MTVFLFQMTTPTQPCFAQLVKFPPMDVFLSEFLFCVNFVKYGPNGIIELIHLYGDMRVATKLRENDVSKAGPAWALVQ